MTVSGLDWWWSLSFFCPRFRCASSPHHERTQRTRYSTHSYIVKTWTLVVAEVFTIQVRKWSSRPSLWRTITVTRLNSLRSSKEDWHAQPHRTTVYRVGMRLKCALILSIISFLSPLFKSVCTFVGFGCLIILDLTLDNRLIPTIRMQWTDGLFDLAFAEDHPDIILTASGDGGIQTWNLKSPQVDAPI